MASGLTQFSDINDLMPKFIAPARYFYEQGQVMKPLVTQYTLPDGNGNTYYIPKFSRLTPARLDEGVPILHAQKINTDNALAIVPQEVGMQVLVSKRSNSFAKEDVLRAVGKITGNAMAIFEDQDLLGLFAGVTATKGGSGTMTVGHVLAARSFIAGNATEPAPRPWSAVVHEWQYHPVATNVIGLTSGGFATIPSPDGLAADTLKDFWIDTIGQVKVYHDNNITVGSPTTGCVFSKEAFVWLTFEGMTTNKTYDEDLRSHKINVIADYGYGMYQDVFACRLTTAAVEPDN